MRSVPAKVSSSPPFLPSPLVEKLTSEGFASKIERGNGADWLVYFWREAD